MQLRIGDDPKKLDHGWKDEEGAVVRFLLLRELVF